MQKRKLMIIGGGYLEVQEILDQLSINKVDIDKVQLAGEGVNIGEIHEFKNEPALVIDIKDMAEQDYHTAVLLSPSENLEKITSTLVLGSVPLIDMAGVFEPSGDVPILLPESDLPLPEKLPMISVLPSGVSHAVTSIVQTLAGKHEWRSVTAMAVKGVSDKGTRQAMDELFDQTRAILGFKEVETVEFEKQIAFNSFHIDEIGSSKAALRESMRMITGNSKLNVHVDSLWGSFFVGVIGTIWLESTENIELDSIESLFSATSGFQILESKTAVLDVVGSDEIQIQVVTEQPNPANFLTLRFSMDNLRRGSASSLVSLFKQVW